MVGELRVEGGRHGRASSVGRRQMFLPPPGGVIEGATCYKALFAMVFCVYWVLQKCYRGG
jgi:hypothetical protein